MRFSWSWALFRLVLVGGAWAASAVAAHAQVWQWSAPVVAAVSAETNDHPRAYLWVPPTCRRVRAVVVGQHNMLEEGVLEHPAFRAELARLGIAEVWVTPMVDPVFDFQHGAAEKFEDMMRALARESGYAELATAPVVPIGHSAAASYPWNFAAWNPGRTLAAISLKGDAPLTGLTGSGRPNPDWGQRTLDGVPGLLVMGEYEWLESRLTPALSYRQQHPASPISLLADAGRGHFDCSDEVVRYLALFIRKAARQRLPARVLPGHSPVLKPIDPSQGWLADRWRADAPPQAPAASAARYQGPAADASWYFDREMAHAAERLYARQRGKQPQLLGFEQQGHVLPQTNTHNQVALRFEPLADGRSFRVRGTFLDSVPGGSPRPVIWAHLPVGSPIGRGGGPLTVTRITGPVEQTGPDTWAIKFNRLGFDNPKRTNDVWLLATHLGDSRFKSAVQQANLRFPLRNTTGAAQQIIFPALADVAANHRLAIALGATSDAGLPVRYYVREGPAEVVGNTVRLTQVPPRAHYPVRVTVVAWQYGVAGTYQSAEPVTRTFSLTR